jgi:hypothetical protein
MTKHPADSSIIATFGWPHSIEYILGHFRKAGTPTTAITSNTFGNPPRRRTSFRR